MIIPVLIVLVAAGLIAGDEDSPAASGSAGSTNATVAASEVGKTKPKIKPSKGQEPRGLEETDLVVGTGVEATSGMEVTVHYVIVLNKNGKEIESSWARGKPYSFELGAGEVTDGWEQGIEGMKEGGRRELVAPAALAYGKAGTENGVGPNEDLLYVIDLLKVKPAPPPAKQEQSQSQQ